jgi:hypothetical protein
MSDTNTDDLETIAERMKESEARERVLVSEEARERLRETRTAFAVLLREYGASTPPGLELGLVLLDQNGRWFDVICFPDEPSAFAWVAERGLEDRFLIAESAPG